MSDSFETQLRAFNVTFDKYRQFNRRSVGELIEVRGRRLRFGLWKAFREMAKTASALRSELAGRGYRIKRRPDPDFIGPREEDSESHRVSVQKEIQLRVRSLKFLSVSFLYQSWRTKKDGQDARFSARSRTMARLGEAVVRTGPASPEPFIELASFLEGVTKQNRRRGVAAKVLRAETADMGDYLKRKHQEELERSFKRVYEGTLGIA